MKYYQPAHFDLVDSITNKLKIHFKDLLSCPKNFARAVYFDELKNLVPELVEQFDQKNLIYDIGRVFVTVAQTDLPIHVDGSDTVQKDIALNWPVWNSHKGVMSWYIASDDSQLVGSNPYYSTYIPYYRNEDCTLVDSYIINEPTWVKIGVPHGVKNLLDANRVVISFRFRPEPYHIWHS